MNTKAKERQDRNNKFESKIKTLENG